MAQIDLGELGSRIQIRRCNGWRMPAGAVRVDRATKWGNPFRADRPTPKVIASGARSAAEAFGFWLRGLGGLDSEFPSQRRAILDSIGELRGKRLACWCRPGDPCHADVLLELANVEDTA